MAKRRGWGEGSITGGNGHWTVRVTSEGRRVKRSVRGTKRDAQDALRALQAEVARGVGSGRMTVANYLARWLERQEREEKSPATVANYRWAIEVHIVPTMGGVRLDKVTPDHVDDLITKMVRQGLAKGTIARVRLTLSMAYDDAVHRRIVWWNPVAPTKVGKANGGRPSRSMTPEQLATFVKAAEGTELEACWLTMVGAGLRPGEATGLQWEDLELDAEPPLLHVRRARIFEPGSRMTFGEPKTKGSVRTLELPATVCSALRAHRVRQAEGRLRAGSLWQDNGLVFPTDTGRPIAPGALRRELRKVTEAAGLGRWHPHELRHTWVSLCSDQGVSLEDLADAAGHATTVLTEGVYRHRVRDVVGSQARQAMDGLLGGA